jgi:hypothetical protein
VSNSNQTKMAFSQVHIHFSVSWVRRLAIRNDFDTMNTYLEKINKKYENIPVEKCPFSEDVWNEIKALFFLMELGATIQNMSVVIESNTKVMKLLSHISELKMWKARLTTIQYSSSKDTIGNLQVLPNDILQVIGDKII